MTRLFIWIAAGIVLVLASAPLLASDHADPVRLPMPKEFFDDPAMPSEPDRRALTGNITDLFVFPVDEHDRAVSFPRPHEQTQPATDDERTKLNQLTAPQRAAILREPSRQARAAKLAAEPPAAPAEATTASREELARFARLAPRERRDWQPLKPEEAQRIKAIVFILCVRPRLPEAGHPLELSPYEYVIRIDPLAPIELDTQSGDERERTRVYSERARYGGSLTDSTKIQPRITFAFRLDDQARLVSFQSTGLVNDEARKRIATFPSSTEAGIRDDPFIFPPFFRTNVVAMAAKVPIECFDPGARSWAIWTASYRDGKKVDHGGRSLRTQQPRFAQIFNEHEPKDQVAAFERERANPGLVRDTLVRLNIPTIFNFRNWDAYPDIMVYNLDHDCRYPNGRLLTDDVGAILAENGDGLLQEISYEGDRWPRATENDKPFLPKFPYLAMPWTPSEVQANPLPANPPSQKDPLRLSDQNRAWIRRVIVLAIGGLLLVAAALVFFGYLLGKRKARRQWRERYL
jgi:hypothetical protein